MRVWWIPQIPMNPFYVPVESIEEGVKIIKTLAEYDLFQLEHNIKPDYSNTGGLQIFDEGDDYDGPDGSWVDWCDPETWEDDPVRWLEEKRLEEKRTKERAACQKP